MHQAFHLIFSGIEREKTKNLKKLLLCVIVVTYFLGTPVNSFATDAGGTISADTTWDLSGSPYLVTSPLIVESGSTLTIAENVSVDLLYPVTVNAGGTLSLLPGSSVDTSGGDDDIFIDGTLTANSSTITCSTSNGGSGHLYIRSGGVLNFANGVTGGSLQLYAYNGSNISISDSTINSYVTISNGSTGSLINNTFSRNVQLDDRDYTIIGNTFNGTLTYNDNSSLVINYNNFVSTSTVLVNNSTSPIDVNFNYWNDPNGPNQSGAQVTGLVEYTQFYTAPIYVRKYETLDKVSSSSPSCSSTGYVEDVPITGFYRSDGAIHVGDDVTAYQRRGFARYDYDNYFYDNLDKYFVNKVLLHTKVLSAASASSDFNITNITNEWPSPEPVPII